MAISFIMVELAFKQSAISSKWYIRDKQQPCKRLNQWFLSDMTIFFFGFICLPNWLHLFHGLAEYSSQTKFNRHFMELMTKNSEWKPISKAFFNSVFTNHIMKFLTEFFYLPLKHIRGWMLHKSTRGLFSTPSSSQTFSITFKLWAVLSLITKVIFLSISDVLYLYADAAESIWMVHLTKSARAFLFLWIFQK